MVENFLKRGQYLQISLKTSAEFLPLGIIRILKVIDSEHAMGRHLKRKIAIELGVVDLVAEFNCGEAAPPRCSDTTNFELQ
jgi:hypothetical protein